MLERLSRRCRPRQVWRPRRVIRGDRDPSKSAAGSTSTRRRLVSRRSGFRQRAEAQWRADDVDRSPCAEEAGERKCLSEQHHREIEELARSVRPAGNARDRPQPRQVSPRDSNMRTSRRSAASRKPTRAAVIRRDVGRVQCLRRPRRRTAASRRVENRLARTAMHWPFAIARSASLRAGRPEAIDERGQHRRRAATWLARGRAVETAARPSRGRTRLARRAAHECRSRETGVGPMRRRRSVTIHSLRGGVDALLKRPRLAGPAGQGRGCSSDDHRGAGRAGERPRSSSAD